MDIIDLEKDKQKEKPKEENDFGLIFSSDLVDNKNILDINFDNNYTNVNIFQKKTITHNRNEIKPHNIFGNRNLNNNQNGLNEINEQLNINENDIEMEMNLNNNTDNSIKKDNTGNSKGIPLLIQIEKESDLLKQNNNLNNIIYAKGNENLNLNSNNNKNQIKMEVKKEASKKPIRELTFNEMFRAEYNLLEIFN